MLVSSYLDVFKDELEPEVLKILKDYGFILWVPPVEYFYKFRDFKIASENSVKLPTDVYMAVMKLQEKLAKMQIELDEAENHDELLSKITTEEITDDVLTVAMAERAKDTGLEDINIQVSDKPITMAELTAEWKPNYINMMVRRSDFDQFWLENSQVEGKEVVDITKEQFEELKACSQHARRLEKLLENE